MSQRWPVNLFGRCVVSPLSQETIQGGQEPCIPSTSQRATKAGPSLSKASGLLPGLGIDMIKYTL